VCFLLILTKTHNNYPTKPFDANYTVTGFEALAEVKAPEQSDRLPRRTPEKMGKVRGTLSFCHLPTAVHQTGSQQAWPPRRATVTPHQHTHHY
jgi:hypothetical protein